MVGRKKDTTKPATESVLMSYTFPLMVTKAPSAFSARVSTGTNVPIRVAVTISSLILLFTTVRTALDERLVASDWVSILTEKAPEEAVWLCVSTLLSEMISAPRLEMDRGSLAIDIIPMSHTGDVRLFIVKELPTRLTVLPSLIVMELTASNMYHAHALPRVREVKVWLVYDTSKRLPFEIVSGSDE